jgi:AraC-like DNA-binding protein
MNHDMAVPLHPRAPLLDWRAFRASIGSLELTAHDAPHDGFRSWIEDSRFGDLWIRHVASSGISVHCERTPDRIRANPEDLIWICVVLGGEFRLEQQDAVANLRAGDFAMVDARRHYALQTERSDTLWIGVPQDTISRHVWDLDELLGVTIHGSHGAGQMASRVLQAAFTTPTDAPDGEANRMVRGVFDVLGAAVDTFRHRHARTPFRSAVLRRIKTYVDQHLEDETLSVAGIARDHGLSPRYLARIFQQEQETVSGWIWNRRLERCHLALRSSSGPASISEVAYAHGFKNLSHFSKAFKERYGVSPSTLVRERSVGTAADGDLGHGQRARVEGPTSMRTRLAIAS